MSEKKEVKKKKITQGKKIRLKKSLVKVKEGRAVGPYSHYYDMVDGKAVRKVLDVHAVNPEVQGENKLKILHPISTSPVWVDGHIFELVPKKVEKK